VCDVATTRKKKSVRIKQRGRAHWVPDLKKYPKTTKKRKK
jgi:hypothetical protein